MPIKSVSNNTARIIRSENRNQRRLGMGALSFADFSSEAPLRSSPKAKSLTEELVDAFFRVFEVAMV